MNKTAVVTGVTGQDGSIFAKLLLSRGFKIIGLYRPSSSNVFWRLEEMGITEKMELIPLEIHAYRNLSSIFASNNIAAFFHFAGSTLTVSSHNNPLEVFQTNTGGALEILNFVKCKSPECFVFLSSSSEVYGNFGENFSISQSGVCKPTNPYGASHASILTISEMFREVHGLRICNGVYFNHESIFRDQRFFSRKLSLGVSSLMKSSDFVLNIGSFDSSRDWGCADEFMFFTFELFRREIQGALDIGTGKLTNLLDVVVVALQSANFEPELYKSDSEQFIYDKKTGRILVRSNEAYIRKHETSPRIADRTILEQSIGDGPQKTLVDIIPQMVRHEAGRMRFAR